MEQRAPSLTRTQLRVLLRLFSERLRADPSDLILQIKVAEVLHLLERDDDALTIFNSVAWSYATAGDVGHAIAICQHVLEIDGEHLATRVMLERLFRRKMQRLKKHEVEVRRVGERWVASDGAEEPGPDTAALPASVSPSSGGGDGPSPRAAGPRRRRRITQPGFAATGELELRDMEPTHPPTEERPPTTVNPSPILTTVTVVERNVEQPEAKPDPAATLRMEAGLVHSPEFNALAGRGGAGQRTARMGSRMIEALLELQGRAAEPAAQSDARPLSEIQGEVVAEGRRHEGEQAPDEEDLERQIKRTMQLSVINGDSAKDTETHRAPFPIFSGLPSEALLAFIKRLVRQTIEAGAYVFEEGDQGDSIFLVSAGNLQVLKENGRGQQLQLARLGGGAFFGEFGLLTDGRRHAGVRALVRSELLELTRDDLMTLSLEFPTIAWTIRNYYQQRVMAMAITTSPIFQNVQPPERREILSRFTFRRFMTRELIIREEEPGTGFFVILVGRVEVSVQREGKTIPLGVLSEGDYFGEISMITGYAAGATVRSVGVTEALMLDSASFYDLAAAYPKIWRDVREMAERRQRKTEEILLNSSAISAPTCLI